MTKRIIALVPLVAAFIAVTTVTLGAQSMPGTVAKNAARRAAAATNAHIEAMQNTGDPAPVKAARQSTATTHIAEVPHTTPSTAAKPTDASKASKASKAPKASAAAPHSKVAARPAHAAKGRDTVTITGPQGAQGEGTTSISERGGKNEIALLRESFSYNADGRRDPFISLITSGELRPMVSDLKLVAVIYDPSGRSVAILRDVTTKEQYRVRTGQTLGRMRVARIDQKAVTFTLEEFGYSRQESLALNDSTRAR